MLLPRRVCTTGGRISFFGLAHCVFYSCSPPTLSMATQRPPEPKTLFIVQVFWGVEEFQGGKMRKEKEKRNTARNVLSKHDLQNTQLLLPFRHVTDIHQQILEEQPVHLLVHVVRVRMRPDQDRDVLARVRVGPEIVRHPWDNLMWLGLARGAGCVDCVDGRVCRRRAHGAAEHVESLGLLEVDVQWRGLYGWRSV